MQSARRLLCWLLPLVLFAGCDKPAAVAPAASTAESKHEHRPPHGGTLVVLGDEAYHLELVADPASGRLQAYVFDGELENFIRSAQPAITIDAMIDGRAQPLVLTAVANPATGETIGDTSHFEGRAAWLQTSPTFDATLERITIRGTTFRAVKFNFPHGNDHD